MQTISIRTLLAVGTTLLPAALFAGQAELDFNDLFLGKTRTDGGDATSPNNTNSNTGSGFADNANGGEFNNNTGVILFIAPDIPVPAGVSNYTSSQGPDINGGDGVVISSSNGSSFRRMQDRHFAAPLLSGDIYFSVLTRILGPEAEMRLMFNTPLASSSTTTTSAFAIGIGDELVPGAIAIVPETSGIFTLQGEPALFFEDVDGDGVVDVDEDTIVVNGILDPGEDVDGDGNLDVAEDLDGNGVHNGIDFNDEAPHLIIGRVQVDVSGADDQIDIWLDPADATSLGTPTLSITSDEIDPALGIFSVGFEGLRRVAANGDDGNGNFTGGGRGDFDHFRISDAADALDFVTGNALPDPSLDIASDSSHGNFAFGATYGTTLPVTSSVRTVKLVNNGATQDIEVASIAFQNGNPDGVFTITNAPATPFTLTPGQSALIEVEASSGDITGQTFSETIIIDTDEDTPDNPQDRNIACSARFFPAGFKVNANGSFDANTAGWENAEFNAPNTPPIRKTPGFNGTTANVRIKGIGDLSNGTPDPQNPIGDNFSQTVPTGAADWEFTFLFSPLDALEFENYSGGLSPFAGDRTFQLAILGNNDIPVAASGTEGQWTDANKGEDTMINLSYQPSGDDFYVFDGSGAGWTALGIGGLLGSVDRPVEQVPTVDTDGDGIDDDWEDLNFGDGIPPADPAELAIADDTTDFDFDGLSDLDEYKNNMDPLFDDTDSDGALDDVDIPGDGALDPSNPNDDVNWYLVRIKGTGFGTPAASYTISVSDANTLNSAQVTSAQTIFQSLDITANTPGGYTFMSGDVSSATGDGAVTTSYWIDEACYWSGQARDPAIAVSPQSLTLIAHNGSGTAEVTVANGGFNSDLNVASLDLASGADFSILSPATPFVVPIGGSQAVTVEYTGTVPTTDTLTINSDDPLTPAIEVALAGLGATSDDNLLANWDFEIPGTDPAGDTDTFAIWSEDRNNTNILDVPGLTAGSNTAGYMGPGIICRNNFGIPAANFSVEFDFAIQGPTQRALALLIRRTGSGAQLNMRYQGDINKFQAFHTGPGWSDLIDLSAAPLTRSVDGDGNGSLDDPGDTKVVYKLLITGSNWDGANSSISLEVFDSAGTSLGSGSGAFFQNGTPNAANQIELSSQFGGNPGWWADDVLIKLLQPPSPGGPALVDVSLNAAQDTGTLTFTGLEVGQTYHVVASVDGENFGPLPGSEFVAGAEDESLNLPVDIVTNPFVIVKGEAGPLP